MSAFFLVLAFILLAVAVLLLSRCFRALLERVSKAEKAIAELRSFNELPGA